MSSINPVVLMPAALAVRAEALAAGFVGSLTLGAGQFCTNPGLVIACKGLALDRFVAAAATALASAAPAPMLTPAIHTAFTAGVTTLDASPAARRVGTGAATDAPNRCTAALFRTTAQSFHADPALAHEVFGASAVIIACTDLAEMAKLMTSLEGQLTATIQLDPADEAAAAGLLPLLQAKAGRVLANGWPTGVEVTHSMVHGGPFPATFDGRSTSVGTLAMARFLRPVCLQDIPDGLLPRRCRPPIRGRFRARSTVAGSCRHDLLACSIRTGWPAWRCCARCCGQGLARGDLRHHARDGARCPGPGPFAG
jgi:NADP-dependent aldehyde dehydrogenase